MKNVIISSGAFVLLFLCSVSHAQTQDICFGYPDGFFLPNVTNCALYYTCVKQLAYAQACPATFFFDSGLQQCGYDQTQCVAKCPTTGVTTLNAGGSCNIYVLCIAGTPYLKSCLDGLEFNSATGQCDFAFNANCAASLPNACKSAPSKIPTYVAVPGSCSKYVLCFNGTGYPDECATDLVFNPTKGGCDLPANYPCTSAATNPASISSRSADVYLSDAAFMTRPEITCPRSGVHFIAHARSCSRYVFCIDGQSALLRCSEGLHYDSKTQSCRLPTFSDCPYV